MVNKSMSLRGESVHIFTALFTSLCQLSQHYVKVLSFFFPRILSPWFIKRELIPKTWIKTYKALHDVVPKLFPSHESLLLKPWTSLFKKATVSQSWRYQTCPVAFLQWQPNWRNRSKYWSKLSSNSRTLPQIMLSKKQTSQSNLSHWVCIDFLFTIKKLAFTSNTHFLPHKVIYHSLHIIFFFLNSVYSFFFSP